MKPYSVPHSVLMVCMGNICRSPTAHEVLRHKAQALGLGLGLQDSVVGHIN
jgi:protein-tyrosine phosphatase